MEKHWWQEVVVYQIYPRSLKFKRRWDWRFKRVLKSIIYAHFKGQAIWLSPVYRHVNDNGCDISDYEDIMDEFGTMTDMEELISEADKRGIKELLWTSL